MTVKTRSDVKKVLRKIKRATITSLGHAGGALRLTARRSIRKSPNPSAPGKPPHTRQGQLRRAIRFFVERDQQRVVIGPEHGEVGPSGGAHEFGGRFRKQSYPKHPFMGPALRKIQNRLPRFWAGSVK